MLYAVETFFRFNFLSDISITGFFVTIKTFNSNSSIVSLIFFSFTSISG